MMIARSLPALVLIACCLGPANAAEPKPVGETPARISYFKQIRPIFQAHCQGCHQPAKKSGEYVMTDFAALLAGGESGDAAVVAGKADASSLVHLITPSDGQAEMPKGKKPLAENDIELIRSWIAQGATDDSPESTRAQFDMEHPPTYAAPPVITSLDFSPDGKWLAVSGYHEVLVHHADGSGLAARLVGLSERIESAVYSPDGKSLAVSGGLPGRMGELQIWDAEARKLKLSLPVGYDTIYGASWSQDGKRIAFGGPDTNVRAIKAESGEQLMFCGAHDDWVLDTVFSVKSDHVISVSRDRSMKLIHVETQRFIDNITSITPGALKGGLHAIDRHPTEDQLLAGGSDGVPKIYRMVREKRRRIGDDFNLVRAFPPLPGRVFDVKFSADGSRIVAGSSMNGQGHVHVYNTADGKPLAKIQVPEGGIYAVAFSRDGKTVASGGFDGYLRLHDSVSGKLIKQFLPVTVEGNAVAATAE